MAIKPHEDPWMRNWEKRVDILLDSFLADHLNYAQRLAKRFEIEWPQPSTILSDEALKSWNLTAMEAVVSALELQLKIKYRPLPPDVMTDDGLLRARMRNTCLRIKAVEAKLGK